MSTIWNWDLNVRMMVISMAQFKLFERLLGQTRTDPYDVDDWENQGVALLRKGIQTSERSLFRDSPRSFTMAWAERTITVRSNTSKFQNLSEE